MPFYSGATHTVWANDGKGNFTVADSDVDPSKKEWKSVKAWKNEIKSEVNSYNSYCGNTMFIDVNDDGMMDMYCDSLPG